MEKKRTSHAALSRLAAFLLLGALVGTRPWSSLAEELRVASDLAFLTSFLLFVGNAFGGTMLLPSGGAESGKGGRRERGAEGVIALARSVALRGIGTAIRWIVQIKGVVELGPFKTLAIEILGCYTMKLALLWWWTRSGSPSTTTTTTTTNNNHNGNSLVGSSARKSGAHDRARKTNVALLLFLVSGFLLIRGGTSSAQVLVSVSTSRSRLTVPAVFLMGGLLETHHLLPIISYFTEDLRWGRGKGDWAAYAFCGVCLLVGAARAVATSSTLMTSAPYGTRPSSWSFYFFALMCALFGYVLPSFFPTIPETMMMRNALRSSTSPRFWGGKLATMEKPETDAISLVVLMLFNSIFAVSFSMGWTLASLVVCFSIWLMGRLVEPLFASVAPPRRASSGRKSAGFSLPLRYDDDDGGGYDDDDDDLGGRIHHDGSGGYEEKFPFHHRSSHSARPLSAILTHAGEVTARFLRDVLSNDDHDVTNHHTNSTGKNSSSSRAIFMFLCLTLSFMFVELSVGAWTGSLGLVSDAGHMFFDSAALFLGLFASYASKWKPDEVYTYGYGRYEIVAGFVNGVFLTFIAVFVFLESIERITEPPELKTEGLLLTSIAGLGVNLIGLMAFHDLGGSSHSHAHSHSHHTHSHAHSHGGGGSDANMRGVYLHVMADALGSIGVIISSTLIQVKGWWIADPICSFFISVLIFASVIPLLKSTANSLMLKTPKENQRAFERCLETTRRSEGVCGVGRAHLWRCSKDLLVATCLVVVDAEPQKESVRSKLAHALRSEVGVHDVTVEVLTRTAAVEMGLSWDE